MVFTRACALVLCFLSAFRAQQGLGQTARTEVGRAELFRRHPQRGTPYQGHPAVPRRKPRGDPASKNTLALVSPLFSSQGFPGRASVRPVFLAKQKIGKVTSKQNPEPQIYLEEGPEFSKTTFFFSIRACPRAAIANCRGLFWAVFQQKCPQSLPHEMRASSLNGEC